MQTPLCFNNRKTRSQFKKVYKEKQVERLKKVELMTSSSVKHGATSVLHITGPRVLIDYFTVDKSNRMNAEERFSRKGRLLSQ